MHVYEVGKPYREGRSQLAPAAHYVYRAGEHELLLILDGPSAQEVRDVRSGDSEFALFEADGPLFFLYRFGKQIPWSDSPFSLWLAPEAERLLPDPAPGTKGLLHVILVEAHTGLIRGLRAVSLSAELTAALHGALAKQATTPWRGRTQYDQAIDRIYSRMSSEDMVAAAGARCRGGA